MEIISFYKQLHLSEVAPCRPQWGQQPLLSSLAEPQLGPEEEPVQVPVPACAHPQPALLSPGALHRHKQGPLRPHSCTTNYSFLSKHTPAPSPLLNLLFWLTFWVVWVFLFHHENIFTQRTKIQTQTIKSEVFPGITLFAVRIIKYEGKEEMVQLPFPKWPLLSPYGWFYCENYHDYTKCQQKPGQIQ